MKIWKSITLGVALGIASLSALAQDTYVLTTGVVGGTYHNVLGVNMRNILRERGINFDVVSSKGSTENLDRIAQGEADIGYTQADAMASWLRVNPTADIEILGSLGEECLNLVALEGSGIEDIQDLNSNDLKIAVGEMGTGSAKTWEFIRTLNPTYAEPQVYHQGGSRALGKVQTGEFDAFLWVTSPENRDHSLLAAVLMENSPFRFVEIDDDKLSDTLPNGTQVYTTREVTGRESVGFFGGDESIETLCTGLTVVADYNLDATVLEAVASAVLMNASRITSPQ